MAPPDKGAVQIERAHFNAGRSALQAHNQKAGRLEQPADSIKADSRL